MWIPSRSTEKPKLCNTTSDSWIGSICCSIPKGEAFQQKFHLKNTLKSRCEVTFVLHVSFLSFVFGSIDGDQFFVCFVFLFSYATTKTPSKFNLKFVVGSLRLFIYNINLPGISRTTFVFFLWQIVISPLYYFEAQKDNIRIFSIFFLIVLSVPFRDGRQGNKITNIIAGKKLREAIKHLEGAAGREDS